MNSAHLTDEERDAPPVTMDFVYLTGVILLVLLLLITFGMSTLAGSLLLHTFDAEIRHGLAWAVDALLRLYWAGLSAWC